jgi:hypothetical protein
MTTVTASAMRPISSDMFLDITGPDCAVTSIRADGSDLTVTFDGDLTDAQVQAIRDRMTSRDDTDQAARANLATLGAAVKAGATLENVAALLLAQNDYLLGVTT